MHPLVTCFFVWPTSTMQNNVYYILYVCEPEAEVVKNPATQLVSKTTVLGSCFCYMLSCEQAGATITAPTRPLPNRSASLSSRNLQCSAPRVHWPCSALMRALLETSTRAGFSPHQVFLQLLDRHLLAHQCFRDWSRPRSQQGNCCIFLCPGDLPTCLHLAIFGHVASSASLL